MKKKLFANIDSTKTYSKGLIKKKEPFVYKASTNDYLKVLTYLPNYVKLIKTKGKPYKKLVDWILEQELLLQDYDFDFPTIKQLASEVGIPATEITLYLPEIYKAILKLNTENPQAFKKDGQKLCTLQYRYRGKYFDFNIGLDVIPRVGEYFIFLFAELECGICGFFVNRVFHNIENEGQAITISFGSQTPNSYLTPLKEKAFLHQEITMWDYLEAEISTKLEEKLLMFNKSL